MLDLDAERGFVGCFVGIQWRVNVCSRGHSSSWSIRGLDGLTWFVETWERSSGVRSLKLSGRNPAIDGID